MTTARLSFPRRIADVALALLAAACGSSPSWSNGAGTQPGGPDASTGAGGSSGAGGSQAGGVASGRGGAPEMVVAPSRGGSRATGGTSSVGGAAATGGVMPDAAISCSVDNGSCVSNGDCCSFPGNAYCVHFGTAVGKCAPVCVSDSACVPGCCAQLSVPGQPGGPRVCVPATFCSGTGGAGGADGGGTGGRSANGGAGAGGAPSTGGTIGTGGAAGDAGGACSATRGTCSANSECCAYPASDHCVNFGGSLGVCTPLCVSNASCSTGCCADLTTNGQPNGSKACAPASYCSGAGGTGAGGSAGCVGDLGSCQTNGDCCGFPDLNRCFDPQIGTGPLCAIVCTSGAECASGCCALLASGYSVCAPTSFCQ